MSASVVNLQQPSHAFNGLDEKLSGNVPVRLGLYHELVETHLNHKLQSGYALHFQAVKDNRMTSCDMTVVKEQKAVY